MESFEEVTMQYEPMISATIRRLNIYRDFDGFRQAGRIALWQAWRRYDPSKGEFAPFAYRSIQGAMLDELKRETRLMERETTGETAVLEQIPAPVRELEMLPDWVQKLGLSREELRLLEYLFIQRFANAEIAAAFGITLAGMKKRRERLLKKVKTLLEEAENF
ncbi:sigma-70 family RNA polymerase sigma factor [Planococcus lenghuensis]|uniref:RNA polymerase sigma-70 region 2 domain-containing protein n=1 Tax=Planococcus lenghuensis TaxID=2213202 RepID=A0A1Q2L423_9BACL|nr:sigma-70 family RNA polymerase sigma factor [Planococcus lenghuensis]AQQ55171.1 hypothetical protein B0X71_16075 [Planococcus lenghuensis]